ncbi:MAG: hypothetical protein ACRC6A_07890 [Fusobacteriaceae bacterium]
MIYYLDVEYAKKGVAFVIDKNDQEISYLESDKSICKYIGEGIPDYIHYNYEKKIIVSSSVSKQVELGIKKLAENEILINGEIKNYSLTHEYVEDGKIIPKTREMLVVSGIEPLQHNEYIKSSSLKVIPRKQKNMYKPEFCFNSEEWVETATQDEIINLKWKEKCLFYNQELAFASKALTELKCNIISQENFEEVKWYMQSIDPYAETYKHTKINMKLERPLIFERYE